MGNEILSALTFSEKRALFSKLRSKLTPSTETPSIHRYPRSNPIPTSIIQQEIWFHEIVVQNSNAYNIPIAIQVEGYFNLAALAKAFRIVIERYEILRTSFYTLEGIPHQKIADHLDFKIEHIAIDSIPTYSREVKALDLLLQFAKKSFNLEVPPLFRAISIEMTADRHIVAFVIHHLLCDNWSLTLLIQEILHLFYTISQDKLVTLPPPPYQYADYSFWEKEMLSSEHAQNKIRDLKERFLALDFALSLPYDHPNFSREHAEVKSRQFVFENATKKAISLVCAQHEWTPYIFFLTAYHVLMYKYTFQQNIVIGASFLSRPSDEDGVIGPFINVALIDAHMGGTMTFHSLANQIKKTVLMMHGYRFIPINKMVKSMNKLSRKNLSLTQVFFGFLNFNVNNIAETPHSDISIKLLNLGNELRVYNTAKFELDLTVWEDSSAMGGSLEYISSAFSDSTIELLLGHYQYICLEVSQNPTLSLKEIGLEAHSSPSTSQSQQFAFELP